MKRRNATADFRRIDKDATIKKYNGNNEKQKGCPQLIAESEEQYTTTKRTLLDSNQECAHIFDKTTDATHGTNQECMTSLTFENQHSALSEEQTKNNHDEQFPPQTSAQDDNGSNNVPYPDFLDELPMSLNSIREYISENDRATAYPCTLQF